MITTKNLPSILSFMGFSSSQFVVSDEGEVPHIKEWLANGPKPSLAKIKAQYKPYMVAKWVAAEKHKIKDALEDSARLGFVTTVNSWKFDSMQRDITALQSTLSHAILTSATLIEVRDYNNVVRAVTQAQLQTIVNDLTANFNALLQKKWSDQTALTSRADHLAFIAEL